jgi:sec-independent protein translocase protein TatB
MTFLGIGIAEWLVIIVIALVVLGPEKFPEVARRAGQLLREFRSMVQSFTQEVGQDIDLSELYELRRELEETRQEMRRLAYQTPKQISKDVNTAVEKTNRAVLQSGDSRKKADKQVVDGALKAEQAENEQVVDSVFKAVPKQDVTVDEPPPAVNHASPALSEASDADSDLETAKSESENMSESLDTEQKSHGNKHI